MITDKESKKLTVGYVKTKETTYLYLPVYSHGMKYIPRISKIDNQCDVTL